MPPTKPLAISLLTLAALTPFAVSGMSASKPTKNNTAAPVLPITHFPNTLSKDCNNGAAKLYDECADQVTILKDALRTARDENKKVLIVYGGEWCIWCYVLDNYFHGKFRSFDYEWRQADGDIQRWSMRERISPIDVKEARALNRYVTNNFVIAHIDPNNYGVV